MNVTRVGVDIAKSVFHVHAVDRHESTNGRPNSSAVSGLNHYVKALNN